MYIYIRIHLRMHIHIRTLQAMNIYSVSVTAGHKPSINEDKKCKEFVPLYKLARISLFVLPQMCLYISWR